MVMNDPSIQQAKELFEKRTKEEFLSDLVYVKPNVEKLKMNKTYRKIATVTAEQFLPLENKIPSGVISTGLGDPRKRNDLDWVIDTLEGRMLVHNGDWICTRIDGEKWAITDDIFKRTYQLVDAVASVDDYKKAIDVITKSTEVIEQYTKSIKYMVSETNRYIESNKTADGVRALVKLKDSLVRNNSTFKEFFDKVA